MFFFGWCFTPALTCECSSACKVALLHAEHAIYQTRCEAAEKGITTNTTTSRGATHLHQEKKATKLKTNEQIIVHPKEHIQNEHTCCEQRGVRTHAHTYVNNDNGTYDCLTHHRHRSCERGGESTIPRIESPVAMPIHWEWALQGFVSRIRQVLHQLHTVSHFVGE